MIGGPRTGIQVTAREGRPGLSAKVNAATSSVFWGGMANSDFKAKVIGDIPHYQGPNAIRGIRFHTAGRDLGVTAWGMNVIDIEAGCTAYPEHDHAKDGQEEVYVVLK